MSVGVGPTMGPVLCKKLESCSPSSEGGCMTAWLADSVIRGIDGKEKSTPAKRFRALRKGSLTSKLARVSPKGPQT
eukprot:1152252-Pelagomonas_calceolata.AAC.3